MLIYLYIAVNVKLCTALNVNLGMQVNLKRVLGVPFAHGTADLVRGHPALVKPGREEVFAEYAGQQHLVLHDVQIQGETLTSSPLTSHGLDRLAETAAVIRVACLVLPV